MKKNQKLILIFWAVLGSSILLIGSCTKKQKGAFTFVGKLVDSCDGQGLADVELVAKFRGRIWPINIPSHDSIGYGKTDVNGNFSILCENWGKGELELIVRNYYAPNYSTGKLIYTRELGNEKGSFIDAQSIACFTKLEGTAIINIKGTYAATDTLYIDNKPYFPIPTDSPIKETYSITNGILGIEYYNMVVPTVHYWGIGKKSYIVHSMSSAQAYSFKINHSFCSIPEQINNITIGN